MKYFMQVHASHVCKNLKLLNPSMHAHIHLKSAMMAVPCLKIICVVAICCSKESTATVHYNEALLQHTIIAITVDWNKSGNKINQSKHRTSKSGIQLKRVTYPENVDNVKSCLYLQRCHI